MISFIVGKPGGGKGLVALKEIISELVNGERPIITNLAIRLEPWVRVIRRRGKAVYKPEIGLRAYLCREYGQDFGAAERVHLLEDSQVSEFFLYRVHEGKLVKIESVARDNAGRVVEYDTKNALLWGGVFYVVDEGWKFFGARNWQETGKGTLFYGAQHRKLSDRWALVCQSSKQIDSALRQVTEDYWVCTNHGKKRMMLWKQPGVFQVAVYGEPPAPGSEAMTRNVFRLDKVGLGGCYDTSGGVGVAGGSGADLGEKTKGLPVWTLLLGIVCVGVGLVGGARLLGWGMGKSLTGGFKKIEEKVGVARSPAGAGSSGTVAGISSSGQSGSRFEPAGGFGSLGRIKEVASAHTVSETLSEPVRVRIVGIQRIDNLRAVVSLSDGRCLTRAEGLERITADYVIVSGVAYYWR